MKNQHLTLTHPHLAKEWCFALNKGLHPDDFTYGSSKSVWWQCPAYADHIYQCRIGHRSKGSGCPYCSGNKVLPGFNDLEFLFPEISQEWHPTKNILHPREVTSKSPRVVWWKCCNHENHEWESSISHRTIRKDKCPICSNKKVLSGFNDLSFLRPDLLKEWNFAKNGSLLPSQVTAGSSKKVWWRCSLNSTHEWEAEVFSRTAKNPTGCPVCSNKKSLPGFNDLCTTHPEVSKTWHPFKNGSLKPSDFTYGSSKKLIWWVCCNHKEHEWQSSIKNRVKSTNCCPFCSGKRVLPGFNDLFTLRPSLSELWDYSKNKNISPKNYSCGSGKEVWWRCKGFSNHQWKSSIKNMSKGNSDCRICSGDIILPGFNDLSTLSPSLAEEWHDTRNGGLTPKEVSRYSNISVWWRCPDNDNHEWISSVANRSSGTGCPICINRKVIKGVNDISTTHPDLSQEWNVSKNGKLSPEDFHAGSSVKVWWKCKNNPNHEWQSKIYSRKYGTGCPICQNKSVLAGFNDLATSCPNLVESWHEFKNLPLTPKDVSKGSRLKIWWTCSNNKNHIWKTSVSNRSKTGCPYCAKYGFNPSKPSWFYLMVREGEQQIGISNDIDTRLKVHKSKGWDLVDLIGPYNGSNILLFETRIKRWLRGKVNLVKGTKENWNKYELKIRSILELQELSGIKLQL